MVKLVDVYDALRSDRQYKQGLSHEEAVRIMLEGDDRVGPEHLDPLLLQIFVDKQDELCGLYDALAQGALGETEEESGPFPETG